MSHMLNLAAIDSRGPRYNDEGELLAESTYPVCVDAESIRSFHRRHDGKHGARLTFKDGGGFAVGNTVDQIAAALAQCGLTFVNVAVDAMPAPAADPQAEGETVDGEGESIEESSAESVAAEEVEEASAEEAPAPRRRARRN